MSYIKHISNETSLTQLNKYELQLVITIIENEIFDIKSKLMVCKEYSLKDLFSSYSSDLSHLLTIYDKLQSQLKLLE